MLLNLKPLETVSEPNLIFWVEFAPIERAEFGDITSNDWDINLLVWILDENIWGTILLYDNEALSFNCVWTFDDKVFKYSEGCRI